MLGKAGKLGILTRPSEDLSVASRDGTTALVLKCTGHHRRPTRLSSSADELVDELDKLV